MAVDTCTTAYTCISCGWCKCHVKESASMTRPSALFFLDNHVPLNAYTELLPLPRRPLTVSQRSCMNVDVFFSLNSAISHSRLNPLYGHLRMLVPDTKPSILSRLSLALATWLLELVPLRVLQLSNFSTCICNTSLIVSSKEHAERMCYTERNSMRLTRITQRSVLTILHARDHC
jgi:hypothetical protein